MTLPIRKLQILEGRGLGSLLGILAVFVPSVVVGFVGESMGTESAVGYVVITLAYVLSIAIATVVLKSWGMSWKSIGLALPKSWRSTVTWAIGAALVSLIVLIALQIVVQILSGPQIAASDQSEYDTISGNLPLLLTWLAAAWTTVAFGEEMLFRAFLINGLARPFQNTKATAALAIVGSAVAFGLAHYSWGWMGVIETAFFGLVLGAAYLRSGRNLWVTIIAHGLANSLKFMVVFLGLA
jgi:membrane protease YdiL (CAAX protease family)